MIVRPAKAGLVISTAAWLLLLPCALDAQQQPPPVHRPSIAIGGGWLGGGALGSSDANLRANSPTRTPFRLFTTSSRFAGAPLVEARAGFGLSRRLSVEARFGFTQPELQTSVSSDAEQAPALAVVERIDQYAIDGGLVVMLDELRIAGLTPFATGGAGYLRQLHEGRTVVEEGHSYHIGGGVKRWLFTRDRHLVRAAGLRGDVRVDFLVGGIASYSGARPRVAASGSVFVTF